ncbi:MAG: 1-(5-phosphoribosyl)-5-((5-phosphoribosylamino)methylideneamino)imidazole-4-carboxamide isomerase, partial [Myxococcales bacterium]|nr:1-(5-phosphoribosyl)-5-((5-phosphoribosylamino)methylideneamino)imidazole-4-carboxamide isomerase [Myxococcales bacterium]
MNLYPAIDIMGGQVVRLKQGEARNKYTYASDPVEKALEFQALGARFLHVVDLDAAFGTGDNREIVRRIVAETALEVQTGGGIRSVEHLRRIFDAGVWRAVIGSAAVESPELVEAAVREFGPGVAVGLDARDGIVRIKGWTEGTGRSVTDVGQQMAAIGVRTFVYTDIARDGMLGTPDISGAIELGEATGARVVVSGGVASVEAIRSAATHPKA